MKSNLTILILMMGLCAPGPASAQDEAPPPFEERRDGDARVVDPFDPDAIDGDAPVMVQVQIEFIELTLEKVTELMFLRDPKGNATPLRTEVQELIKAGEAKMFETMMIVARPGQKATSESIRELIYPTEHVPAGVPEEVHAGAGAEVTAVTPPMPTAFDMRPVGSTLEIEPNIGADLRTIEIRLSPEIVEHAGSTDWMKYKDALGAENALKMPDFHTLRVTTGVSTRDGDYCFLSILTPRGEDGNPDNQRKLMVFLKADLKQVGK